jgi:hypothetical protein
VCFYEKKNGFRFIGKVTCPSKQLNLNELDFASRQPWVGHHGNKGAFKQHGKLGFNSSSRPTRLNMGFGMNLGTNQACFETNINVGFWGNIQLS